MQPLTILGPLLYATFLWWFLTGLIMAIYGRSPLLIRAAFGVATLLLLAALGGVVATRHALDPRSVYLAVTCGLVIWGWHTVSYYLGFVTGPTAAVTRSNPPQDLAGRFRQALRASLYHELLILACALLLAALTWAQANRWGLWVFLTMWLMHLSAKLNIFLGVRNFRMEFLPSHLHHLDALVNKQPSNPFLPASVIVASSAALLFGYRALAPGALPGETVGFLMTATLIGLGVLEHLLLVLPLPAILWGWGTRPLHRLNRREHEERREKARLSAVSSVSSAVSSCD
jgi:putative photosynthetic complex assembly protein 2